MISFVRGTIAHVGADRLVVDVGALGLSVMCTPATARSVRTGEHLELMTSLVVREDGWTLYGFLDAEECSTFEQVQTVSGIGPRIALALLESLSPDDLRRAVSVGDEASLMTVSGIGRKGAQRLILELGDRLGPPHPVAGVAVKSGSSGWRASVEAGLTSLGWSAREAEQATAAIDPDIAAAANAAGSQADISALLKAALRSLDRG